MWPRSLGRSALEEVSSFLIVARGPGCDWNKVSFGARHTGTHSTRRSIGLGPRPAAQCDRHAPHSARRRPHVIAPADGVGLGLTPKERASGWPISLCTVDFLRRTWGGKAREVPRRAGAAMADRELVPKGAAIPRLSNFERPGSTTPGTRTKNYWLSFLPSHKSADASVRARSASATGAGAGVHF